MISCSIKHDLAAFRLAQTGQHLGQFLLAVAGDAGNAKNFTFADGKGNIIQGREAFIVAAPRDFPPEGWVFPVSTSGLSSLKMTSLPTISFGQDFLGGIFRVPYGR